MSGTSLHTIRYKKEILPEKAILLEYLNSDFGSLRKSAIRLLSYYPDDESISALRTRINGIHNEIKELISNGADTPRSSPQLYTDAIEEYLEILSVLEQIHSDDALEVLLEEAEKLPDVPTLGNPAGKSPQYLNLHRHLTGFAMEKHPLLKMFIYEVLNLKNLEGFSEFGFGIKETSVEPRLRDFSLQTKAVALYLSSYYYNPETFPIDRLYIAILERDFKNIPFRMLFPEDGLSGMAYTERIWGELAYYSLSGLAQIGNREVVGILIRFINEEVPLGSMLTEHTISYYLGLLADIAPPESEQIFITFLEQFSDYGQEKIALRGYLRTSKNPDIELIARILPRYKNSISELKYYLKRIAEKNSEFIMQLLQNHSELKSGVLSGILLLIKFGNIRGAIPLLEEIFDSYIDAEEFHKALRIIEPLKTIGDRDTLLWMVHKLKKMMDKTYRKAYIQTLMPINTIVAQIIDNLPIHPSIKAFEELVRLLISKANIGLINKAKLFLTTSLIFKALKEKGNSQLTYKRISELFGDSIFNPYSEKLIEIIEDNPDHSLMNGFLVEGLYNYRPIEDCIHIIRELIVLDKIPYHSINIIFKNLPEVFLYSFLFSDNPLIKQTALRTLIGRGWKPETREEWFQFAQIRGELAILFAHGNETGEFLYQSYRDNEDPRIRIALIKKLVDIKFDSPDFIEDLGRLLVDYPEYVAMRGMASDSTNKTNLNKDSDGLTSDTPKSHLIESSTPMEILSDPIWTDNWMSSSPDNQFIFEEADDDIKPINRSDPNEFIKMLKSNLHGNKHNLLKRTDPRLRKTAAWALGQIGSLQEIGLLKHGLNDPDPEVRSAVKDAIISIRKRLIKDLKE